MGLYKRFNLLLIRFVLSDKERERADYYFNRTIGEFKKKNMRKPNKNEMFSLVVKTSHRVFGVKRFKGRKGHMKRQWIRKYLLLRNNIRKGYKIQKPKK